MLWWFGRCAGTPERRGVEKTDHEDVMQPARSKTLCNKRPRWFQSLLILALKRNGK